MKTHTGVECLTEREAFAYLAIAVINQALMDKKGLKGRECGALGGTRELVYRWEVDGFLNSKWCQFLLESASDFKYYQLLERVGI